MNRTIAWKNNNERTSHTGYFLRKVEMKEHNVMISGQIFFDQPGKNDLWSYNNVWEITVGQRDDYTAGCLLNYNYFKNY